MGNLGKTVHGTGLEKPEFWNQWGKKLAETQKTLTDAGWGVFEALCPEGSGPSFEAREKLAKALADRKKPKEEPKKEERKRSRSRYQVPKDKPKTLIAEVIAVIVVIGTAATTEIAVVATAIVGE